MRVRIITIVVVLAVLVSSITACTSKGGYLVKVMELAPENTYIVRVIDVSKVMEDPDFNFMYDSMVNNSSYMLVDIDASDVSAFASFEIVWGDIFVLIGDFNLEDVRDVLEENYLVEGEYGGVEIWTDDHDYAVAFIDNMIVSGYKDAVEACIRTYNNEESSIYDNEDMKGVADKLPTAIVHVVFGPDFMYGIEILAGGVCLRNQQRDDEVLDITGWLKFDSEASAEAALEDAEDELEHALGTTQISSQLRGQFIEITAEMEIPEY